MSNFALHLFGPPRLELDGAPVHISRRKATALLAYLAVMGQSHSRDTLATMLWPDSDQNRARGGLRRMLSEINKILGEGWLESDWETARLNIHNQPANGGSFWLDVADFQEKIKGCEAHNHPTNMACPDCLPALEEAVKLYQDDFMAGFSLKDCPAYDEWQFYERDELRAQLTGTLMRLSSYYGDEQEYEAAIGHARHWLALDALDEQAHRQLMTLYDQAGQRSLALRQYETCRQTLEEEMGVEPSEETKELLQRIRASTLVASRDTAPKSNLPVPTTPFIGRVPELFEIRAKLKSDDCRLLTLLGPGGSGKTRLAIESAGALSDDYTQAVFFADLAPLQSADLMVSTIASAIKFTFYEGGGTPEEQLLDYLRNRQMLLILDNFEHLLDGAGFVNQILSAALKIKILATSRIRLMVTGEHIYDVWGMAYPQSAVSLEIAKEQYSGIRLFESEASRVQTDFKLSEDNLQDVIQVCALLEGMPLGIMLAANWMRMLKPAEIAKEVSRDIDFLEAQMRDLPRRQRGMRGVFNHSWCLLSEDRQEIMLALSVFRGGFTREAAWKVAGASLPDLMDLVDHSMLHRTSNGRFEMHELVRQYAAEKLTSDPAAETGILEKHSKAYCQALTVWERDLQGSRQTEAFQEMVVEFDNIRSAWNWAVENVRVRLLLGGINGLCIFTGYYPNTRLEGEMICRSLVEKLDTLLAPEKSAPNSFDENSVVHIDSLKLKARALAWSGYLNMWLGNFDRSDKLIQRCLFLLESDELAGEDTRFEDGLAYLTLSWILIDNPREETKSLAEKALGLFRSLDEPWWVSNGLGVLGAESVSVSEEIYYFEQALAIYRKLGGLKDIAGALERHSTNLASLFQFEEAEAMLFEALAISTELENWNDVDGISAVLGRQWVLQGQFWKARSLYGDTLAKNHDLGFTQAGTAWLHVAACEPDLYMGAYVEARNQAQHVNNIFKDLKHFSAVNGIAYANDILGRIALAEGGYAEAQDYLMECISIYQPRQSRYDIGEALASLGYAARGLNLILEAKRYFRDSLQVAMNREEFSPLIHALPGIGLLFADQGDSERAVELYALASTLDMVANSKWFADIAGDEIADVTARLPVEVAEAAMARGREKDLWKAAAELQAELDEMGWNSKDQQIELVASNKEKN